MRFWNGGGVVILAYHEFSEEPQRDVYAVTRERFQRQAALISWNFGRNDCITFDDAHLSQFAIAAPLLDQMGLHGTFFATTDRIGRHPDTMSWVQLRKLHRTGHTIASHTHTHPMLTACGDHDLCNELVVSKQLIEDALGTEVSSISMPSGRVDARVLAACRAAGYRRVYTSRVGEYKPATDTLPEVIGRLIVRRTTSEKTLIEYLQGEARTCRWLRLESTAKDLAKALLGDFLYQQVWRSAVRSRSYRN